MTHWGSVTLESGCLGPVLPLPLTGRVTSAVFPDLRFLICKMGRWATRLESSLQHGQADVLEEGVGEGLVSPLATVPTSAPDTAADLTSYPSLKDLK